MRYASCSRRASALAIDSIWWTVIVLFVPLGPSTEEILTAPDSFASTIVLWLAIGQCIPILITGLLWATWGTSPGKRALHLRIVDADTGRPMTVQQAGLRTLGYLLTFATCGAGFLWVLFNQRKQTLHDRIANTVVIDDGPVGGAQRMRARPMMGQSHRKNQSDG
ncbi:RDD family protein [Paraburkholderia pallida]|uniref:RDD family protein n=1 Tax=Paraburkholderia pallida TaxID=2547399 RepID=A0A4P7CWM4_9BURK|nr:RDD family protein [Paraburkholderia pallida]QBQ99807.1 RDD family protein [Paraburkholderia pallida]